MTADRLIPLASLVISFTVMFYGILSFRGTRNLQYEQSLAGRVERLEHDLQTAQIEIERLKAENFDLLRRLLLAEKA